MAMSREEWGNITVAGGASTANFTFATAFKAATTPDVDVANKPRNTDYWFTNITNTGATLNLGAAAGSAGETWRYHVRGVDT